MWHIAFKVEFMWVDSGWVVWGGLPRQRWTLSISLFLRRFSKEAWEGLEKPLGTFRTESFVECGEKCSGLDGCGMIDYDMHDNRGYKWCTPAKVDNILYFAVLSFNSSDYLHPPRSSDPEKEVRLRLRTLVWRCHCLHVY